jgi:hypothetical protein
MYDVELVGRLRRLGMPPKLANDTARDIRDRIHPVAVVAAQALQNGEKNRGLGINAQSAATTAGYVTMGAKIGSVIPGIGTVVGAVVGAAVAALKHVLGNHDVRLSPQDRMKAAAILQQYMAAANLAGPNGALGAQLDSGQLQQVFFSAQAMYGGELGSVDPRFFDVGWQICDGLAKQIAKAATTLPPGSTFNISAVSGRSGTGRVFTFGPTTAQLPAVVNLQTLGDLLTQLMVRQTTEISMSAADRAYQNKHDPGGKKAAGFWLNHAENRRVMVDVIAYELQKLNPSVFLDPSNISPPPAPGVPQITPTAPVVRDATALALINSAQGNVPSITSQAMVPASFPTTYVPAVAPGTLPPVADTSAALMQQQLAAQGVNMTSPDAQALIADVAQQGVQATPEGPAKAGIGLVPGLLIGAVALGFIVSGGKKHGN